MIAPLEETETPFRAPDAPEQQDRLLTGVRALDSLLGLVAGLLFAYLGWQGFTQFVARLLNSTGAAAFLVIMGAPLVWLLLGLALSVPLKRHYSRLGTAFRVTLGVVLCLTLVVLTLFYALVSGFKPR